MRGDNISKLLSQSNHSGCQNITLAIKASPVVPSGYGHASRITSSDLGPDHTRSPGLYSGTGSACGDLRGHGAGVTGAELHVTGAAEPNLTQFFTSAVERPTPSRTSPL